jgi:excisionase family DNA binding protein
VTTIDAQHQSFHPNTRRLPDPREQPTITVEHAAAIFGISRGAAYEAVRTGTLPSIRIGRRLLVPTARVAIILGANMPAADDL